MQSVTCRQVEIQSHRSFLEKVRLLEFRPSRMIGRFVIPQLAHGTERAYPFCHATLVSTVFGTSYTLRFGYRPA
jgi:hypothetical protein